jgi:N-dimethylarginine dimethylaminohydrolase
VVVTPGTIDESLLSDLRVVHEMTHERHSFSALRMRNGDVLATDNAPDTTEVVSGLGLNMVPIDVSEIQAADGGLTCMSILIDG